MGTYTLSLVPDQALVANAKLMKIVPINMLQNRRYTIWITD